MTVPLEEYIAVAAKVSYLKLVERLANGEAHPNGDIVSCRERGYVVIVARGEVADELEKALTYCAETLK